MLLNQAAPASTALTFPKKSSKTRTTQFQPAPVPLPALPAGAGTRGNHVRASRSGTRSMRSAYLSFFLFSAFEKRIVVICMRVTLGRAPSQPPRRAAWFIFFLSRGKLSHLQGRHSSASHAYVPRKRSTTSPLRPPPFQPFWKPKSGSDPSFSVT